MWMQRMPAGTLGHSCLKMQYCTPLEGARREYVRGRDKHTNERLDLSRNFFGTELPGVAISPPLVCTRFPPPISIP